MYKESDLHGLLQVLRRSVCVLRTSRARYETYQRKTCTCVYMYKSSLKEHSGIRSVGSESSLSGKLYSVSNESRTKNYYHANATGSPIDRWHMLYERNLKTWKSAVARLRRASELIQTPLFHVLRFSSMLDTQCKNYKPSYQITMFIKPKNFYINRKTQCIDWVNTQDRREYRNSRKYIWCSLC